MDLSTVATIVKEVSEALVSNLWDISVAAHFLQNEAEFKEKMLDFEEFPSCWSAVDGCHIPIKCPAGGLQSCKEYQNFKNFYSIVLMGMVDAKHRFIWASCGFPGNSHDSIILCLLTCLYVHLFGFDSSRKELRMRILNLLRQIEIYSDSSRASAELCNIARQGLSSQVPLSSKKLGSESEPVPRDSMKNIRIKENNITGRSTQTSLTPTMRRSGQVLTANTVLTMLFN